MSGNRACYVCCVYFGDRRRTISDYEQDRLCFLKKQIETLNSFHHNLDLIVFSINIEPEHYAYMNQALKIIPSKIQNTPVEVFLRKNIGLSYGAYSETFMRHRQNFDYFVFNEDDYFFVENDWDAYLMTKYNSLPNSGYLCGVQRDEDPNWNGNRIHAGHSSGIASTRALSMVWEKYGCLPHCSDSNEYASLEEVQKEFGHSFVKVGLRVYDVREEYQVAIARTEEDVEDVWRWFSWNDKDLIVPAIIAFDKPYTWWESFDGPCLRRTNLEKYE